MLSANTDRLVYIESAYKEVDFKTKITREEFYDDAGDLLARVAAPLDQALQIAKLQPSDLESCILIGGSTRMPGVQQQIKHLLKTYGRSFNI